MLNMKTIAFCFMLATECFGSGEYKTNDPYMPIFIEPVEQCDVKKIIIRTKTVHPLILQAYRQLRNQK